MRQSLADLLHLGRIVQFDQDHIRHRVRTVHFGFRFRADAVPGKERHEDGWLQGILLPSGNTDHAQGEKFIPGALRHAKVSVSPTQATAQRGVAVDDHFLRQIGAELVALYHVRLAGVAGFNTQQGHLERLILLGRTSVALAVPSMPASATPSTRRTAPGGRVPGGWPG